MASDYERIFSADIPEENKHALWELRCRHEATVKTASSLYSGFMLAPLLGQMLTGMDELRWGKGGPDVGYIAP